MAATAPETCAEPCAGTGAMAPPATRPVLEVRGLQIRLPAGAERALALQDASFRLLPGQTLCVVGESGSGKSILANAIMGLLPRPRVEPVAGQILLDGTDLLTLDEARLRALRGRRMAMVFQEPMSALNPVLRIGAQLGEALDAHLQLTAGQKRERILAALADVGLPDPQRLIDSYPHRLSGGQCQRVLIACAMLLAPGLLIADEPTTALDVTTQAQVLKLMRRLQQRSAMAMLFITHDFGVVCEIADQVLVLQAGRVVESGPARALLEQPRHPYTRQLIAAIPQGPPRAARTGPEPAQLLQVHNLCKTYVSGAGLFRRARQVVAAHDVSLELRRGQTLGLVGESGSGKSSLGRCIVGLAAFESGRILLRGRNLLQGAALRRQAEGRIQMVFQDPYASLNPRQRIGAAIAAGPIAQGVPKANAMRRALELLELVGLQAAAAERWPHEFSGGQRQRIGIARALAMEPELLVADEPVSALDMSVQAQVLTLLAQLRERLSLAMLFITHDLRVAGQMCDQIAVMQSGRIVEYGPAAEVLTQPRHGYTRSLIAAIPRLGKRPAAP